MALHLRLASPAPEPPEIFPGVRAGGVGGDRKLPTENKALLMPTRNALLWVQRSLARYITGMNVRAAALTANVVERILTHYGLGASDPIRKSYKCYGNMHCSSMFKEVDVNGRPNN